MKKLLLLGVSALLVSTLGASAQGYQSVRLFLNNGRGDVFTITQQYDDFYGQQHWGRTGVETFGVGMTASTPYFYKGIIVTDFGKNGQYQVCYNFELPFHTGGHWIAYRTHDGQKVMFMGKGTYKVLPWVMGN